MLDAISVKEAVEKMADFQTTDSEAARKWQNGKRTAFRAFLDAPRRRRRVLRFRKTSKN